MRRNSTILAAMALVVVGAACTVQKEPPDLVGQDVRVTFIHTSDIHSRLLPYHFVPGRIDQNYGLLPNHGPYGGIARIGAIVKRERAKSARSLWLDSGDCFQGAPIFNLYKGEAEFRSLTEVGLDGAVIGNHEFDWGGWNLYDQAIDYAGFDLLAANYIFTDPRESNVPRIAEIAKPFAMYDLDGITVAAIGMANTSSLTSIFEGDNSLGIRPIADDKAVEQWVSVVRPAADLVVLVSHLGLDEDEGLAPADVNDMNEELPLEGVDLILGGHLHIVLNPPKIVQIDEFGHPTLIVHSGAFAKYVGRLDLLVHKGESNADPGRRSYIKGFTYHNFPVACGYRPPGSEDEPCPEPEDPDALALLQPYALELNRVIDLEGTFAYVNTSDSEKIVRNDPSGGDSQLGNLVARSMQVRPGVDADFAITNSLGIRADFEYGALTVESMYNVFPFENSITVMFLSGSEVRDTLNFVARKSSERGCRTQAQVAGISFKMVCGSDARAEDIMIGDNCRENGELVEGRCQPLIDSALYRVAVNDYIAAGGSGFDALKRNTSKQNTGISLRAALQDYLRGLGDCDPMLIDATDPPNLVVDKYGPITCLNETVEAHDDRIYPVFE